MHAEPCAAYSAEAGRATEQLDDEPATEQLRPPTLADRATGRHAKLPLFIIDALLGGIVTNGGDEEDGTGTVADSGNDDVTDKVMTGQNAGDGDEAHGTCSHSTADVGAANDSSLANGFVGNVVTDGADDDGTGSDVGVEDVMGQDVSRCHGDLAIRVVVAAAVPAVWQRYGCRACLRFTEAALN